MTGDLSTRATLVGVVVSVLFLAIVVELIRRHRLQERYSIVWIGMGVVLFVASAMNESVNLLAGVVGIQDPRFSIVLLVLLFCILLLLHLSTVVSRLSDHTVRLAQELAIVRAELDRVEHRELQRETDEAAVVEPLDAPRRVY